MGNCVSLARQRRDSGGTVNGVDLLYTKPSGLYSTCEWDVKYVRRLILRGELAPRYPGRDDIDDEALEECPICMLVYPVLNQTRCCTGRLCTECYLQVRPPRHNKQPCPFCKSRRVEAVLMGPLPPAQIERQERDRQAALDAYKRLSESAPAPSEHPHSSPSTSAAPSAASPAFVSLPSSSVDYSNRSMENEFSPDHIRIRDAAHDIEIPDETSLLDLQHDVPDDDDDDDEAAIVRSRYPCPSLHSRLAEAMRASRPEDAHICPRGDCPPHHTHLYPHHLWGSLLEQALYTEPPSRPDALLLEAMASELSVPSVRSVTDRASNASASASASGCPSASASPPSSFHALDTSNLPPCASCIQCNDSLSFFSPVSHYVP